MSGKVITRRGGNGLPDAGRKLQRVEARQGSAQLHDGERNTPEPSYYDVSILKSPVWGWEIASYFYLGGLSTGAYLLGRMASRFGGERFADVARVGPQVALATLLPCPPLLIHDLGDPKRFHHMLRVWKPTSPMNLGTWAITGYGGMVAFEVARQLITDRSDKISKRHPTKLAKAVNNPAVLLAHDVAGIPFSLLVAGYTGVLLSCTSNPLWTKNSWLGPLFSASALATGAEATSLVMNLKSADVDETPQRALMLVDTIAHAVELICNFGFTKEAGDKAQPLTTGSMAKHHHFSIRALIAAEALKFIPTPAAFVRLKRVIVALLGLSAGWSLRWGMVHGGIEAAKDPAIARLASKPHEVS